MSMNPFTYVRTHWHAMVIGAVVWHFAGPAIMGQVGSLTSGAKGQ
jgi:predicted membrane channel-forming protein YqfA (hemolysin III family)